MRDPEFEPSRLILARNRMAVSRKYLAELSGISVRSLAAYENGESSPGEENLSKMSSTLKVREEFFLGKPLEEIPVSAVSFRKLSKTSATVQRAVLADLQLTCEMYSFISEEYELPEQAIPDLSHMTPSMAAEILRSIWNLSDRPVSNIIHLLESKGVRFGSLNPEFSDVDAFCLIRDESPYVVLNPSRSAERQRFDVAHELGHLVLHRDHELLPEGSREREAQAQDFASCFLMPESSIRARTRPGFTAVDIINAKGYWKVSAMALAHRLSQLGLLSDWQYRSVCIELSSLGFRKYEPGGIHAETSQLLRKVIGSGGSLINVGVLARSMNLPRDETAGLISGLVPVAG